MIPYLGLVKTHAIPWDWYIFTYMNGWFFICFYGKGNNIQYIPYLDGMGYILTFK